MEIIPAECISVLPFSAESISSWSHTTDLLDFLYKLFDKTGSMMDEAGRVTDVNYRGFGKTCFDEGLERFRLLAADFEKYAKRAKCAPAAQRQRESTPDFLQDEAFGLMAKHAIAWDAIESEVLSESAFFSLAHMLEADSEIECAILLASRLYYKQALQVLRNFLEEVVMDLHFCQNRAELKMWKAGTYRNPPLRGKDGVLCGLLSSGVISKELCDEIATIYGNLNGSIHGAERQLMHRGLFRGNWSGVVFKYERLREWCNYLSRCVGAGIGVVRITCNLWSKTRPGDRILCAVCHGDDFELEKHEFAGVPEVTLRCCVCGWQGTYDAEIIAHLRY